jgi:hypothetical protein
LGVKEPQVLVGAQDFDRHAGRADRWSWHLFVT